MNDLDQATPFIIWTLRRTGGTTLNDLLMALSPFPVGLHEPFNHERDFGWISKAFGETGDVRALHANVGGVLDDKPLFKTAFELQPPPINKAILTEALARGYKHVVLDRRAEVKRLMSLELARLTGGWGKMDAERIYQSYRSGETEMAPFDVDWLLGHLHYCNKMRATLQQLMIETGTRPFVVYFEDVYLDHDQGRRVISDLVKFLGMSPEALPDFEHRVDDALTYKGQNSARMLDLVPNLDDARARLEAAESPHDFAF